uniref:Uncharacterized protein n=1 Tax=Athene cunicularia TaxID=194338 RepID=A0A663LSI4_ATHCN
TSAGNTTQASEPPQVRTPTLFPIEKCTQEKGPTLVSNVGKASDETLTLEITREPTLVKGPSNACTVEKASVISQRSPSTSKPTQARSPQPAVGSVSKCSHQQTPASPHRRKTLYVC